MDEASTTKVLVVVRCVERAFIVAAASLCCWIGYLLYSLSVEAGNVEVSFKDLILKGTGPGILFMCAGVFLLWQTLRTPLRVVVHGQDGQSEIVVQTVEHGRHVDPKSR